MSGDILMMEEENPTKKCEGLSAHWGRADLQYCDTDLCKEIPG